MTRRTLLDVSHTPTFAFGSRSPLWWSLIAMMAIEGTVFLLVIASYFYLLGNHTDWPPADTLLPAVFFGTLNTTILLVSLAPNEWVKRSAEKLDLRKVRIGMVVMSAFGLAFLVVRVFEFGSLNVRWDSNAYGSATWVLLGLHAAHQLIDVIDTIVLTVLMFTGPIEGKRYVDVSENSLYWYFVVLSWLPIYAVIYWVPRWI